MPHDRCSTCATTVAAMPLTGRRRLKYMYDLGQLAEVLCLEVRVDADILTGWLFFASYYGNSLRLVGLTKSAGRTTVLDYDGTMKWGLL